MEFDCYASPVIYDSLKALEDVEIIYSDTVFNQEENRIEKIYFAKKVVLSIEQCSITFGSALSLIVLEESSSKRHSQLFTMLRRQKLQRLVMMMNNKIKKKNM